MPRRHLLWLICGIGLLPLPAPAAVPEQPARPLRPAWAERVDALLEDYAGQRPGISVAVSEHGRLRYQRSAGVAELEPPTPLDVRSNFRLASVSKQFTAMAILQLVADGRLRLDETLADVFPGFPAYGHRISIEQLLQHRSGLPDYEDLLDPARHEQVRDAEVLDLLKRTDAPLFAPGSQWRYSNSGYVLLGLVVEARSGLRFGEFLRQRLFAPLGMEGSMAYAPNADIPRRAYGHAGTASGGYRRDDQSITSATLGDGGIYASIEDLLKWQRALFAGELLPARLQAAMFTPVSRGQPGQGYGYGWFVDEIAGGQPRYWHSGSTRGFRNFVVHYPANGLTVSVLGNSEDTDATTLAGRIVQTVQPDLPVVSADMIPP